MPGGDSSDNGPVVPIIPVSVKLDEIVKQLSDIVAGNQPVLASGDENRIPGAQLAVGNILELLLRGPLNHSALSLKGLLHSGQKLCLPLFSKGLPIG